MPPAAEYFVGSVQGELVCHVAVAPLFTAHAYRATRLVVMPEWQGAGVGTKFLEWICQYHLEGKGRCGKKFGTLFHTSHPQLCAYLRSSSKWIQKSAQLYGANKAKSGATIYRAAVKHNAKSKGHPEIKTGGFGGHFRAIQGFKYLGNGKATEAASEAHQNITIKAANL